uniref:Putative secreted protein n=1 Tax=Ixodes ricinus TaxID=34613 RepID=A0A6B0UC11_IXORI
MHRTLPLWPMSVRTILAASRFQIFTAPDIEPAQTISSAGQNLTHSTAVVWPVRLMMQLVFPMAHRFTLLSSPPVTITLPDLRPIARHLTVEP